MSLPLVECVYPRSGDAITYRAVGFTRNGEQHEVEIGPDHYRVSFLAEEDARGMMARGLGPVYVEQLNRAYQVVGRWAALAHGVRWQDCPQARRCR